MLPRIRTIKPEFFRHEQLFDLEKATGLPMRVAFVGLWCCCDREGRFYWRPRTLKALILPYDDVDFSRVLDALTTRGFVVKYASNGEEFGYIPTWNKHQSINNRESRSIIPKPIFNQQLDASGTRQARVDDACHTGTGTGTGTGTDINIEIPYDSKAPEDETAPTFQQFIEIYPRREKRIPAQRAWTRIPIRERAAVMVGLAAWIGCDQWKNPQYVPLPATFLNAKQWNDTPIKFIKENGNGAGHHRNDSGKITGAVHEAGKEYRKPKSYDE